MSARREVRDLRRRLAEIERRLTEDDLADWALVHALVQADWYRRAMARTRVRHVIVEAGALVLAASATVLAALSAPAWITAMVAAAVTMLAGLRQLFGWHSDWVAAAAAWSRAMALIAQYRLLGPDERTPERRRALVAEIDALVVDETDQWAQRRLSLPEQAVPEQAVPERAVPEQA